MNAVSHEPIPPEPNHTPWSPLRWLAYVTLALAIHVGLIFVFGNRKPLKPRAVVAAPSIKIVTTESALFTLDDPTLFALPHPHGFAGASWLQLPRVGFAPFRWTEAPELMELPVGKLGLAFMHYAQTNAAAPLQLNLLAPPTVTLVEVPDQPTALKQRSSVRVAGPLAQRRWLNAPDILRSWPAADVLTNSVVQVTIDRDGQNFRATLMPPGSGSKPADEFALEFARSARFTPTARQSGPLTVGTMIFEWHAIPLPETNAPSASP